MDAPEAEVVVRVLVVDDEPEPLRATARLLRAAGFEVDTAARGRDAASAVDERGYDVVVSDISMPDMSGIELLEFVHARDPDVPVILVTGAPAVETAVQALDYGAFKYLLKPVSPERLEQEVNKAAQLRKMARIQREAAKVARGPDPELSALYERAVSKLWMAYQPIVTREGELYGHEALMRCDEPSMASPLLLLAAAERVSTLADLGRRTRALAADPFLDGTAAGTLFVNLNPAELHDDAIVAADSPLARVAPRVVLEITERASVGSMQEVRRRVATLRALGYRIAVDDLGAGYAGLSTFALLEPEIVKLDMSLVRDVDQSPLKQRLIRSMAELCRDMGIRIVGEGVETTAERDALLELGCDLFQGYFVGRPGRAFPGFGW